MAVAAQRRALRTLAVLFVASVALAATAAPCTADEATHDPVKRTVTSDTDGAGPAEYHKGIDCEVDIACSDSAATLVIDSLEGYIGYETGFTKRQYTAHFLSIGPNNLVFSRDLATYGVRNLALPNRTATLRFYVMTSNYALINAKGFTLKYSCRTDVESPYVALGCPANLTLTGPGGRVDAGVAPYMVSHHPCVWRIDCRAHGGGAVRFTQMRVVLTRAYNENWVTVAPVPSRGGTVHILDGTSSGDALTIGDGRVVVVTAGLTNSLQIPNVSFTYQCVPPPPGPVSVECSASGIDVAPVAIGVVGTVATDFDPHLGLRTEPTAYRQLTTCEWRIACASPTDVIRLESLQGRLGYGSGGSARYYRGFTAKLRVVTPEGSLLFSLHVAEFKLPVVLRHAAARIRFEEPPLSFRRTMLDNYGFALNYTCVAPPVPVAQLPARGCPNADDNVTLTAASGSVEVGVAPRLPLYQSCFWTITCPDPALQVVLTALSAMLRVGGRVGIRAAVPSTTSGTDWSPGGAIDHDVATGTSALVVTIAAASHADSNIEGRFAYECRPGDATHVPPMCAPHSDPHVVALSASDDTFIASDIDGGSGGVLYTVPVGGDLDCAWRLECPAGMHIQVRNVTGKVGYDTRGNNALDQSRHRITMYPAGLVLAKSLDHFEVPFTVGARNATVRFQAPGVPQESDLRGVRDNVGFTLQVGCVLPARDEPLTLLGCPALADNATLLALRGAASAGIAPIVYARHPCEWTVRCPAAMQVRLDALSLAVTRTTSTPTTFTVVPLDGADAPTLTDERAAGLISVLWPVNSTDVVEQHAGTLTRPAHFSSSAVRVRFDLGSTRFGVRGFSLNYSCIAAADAPTLTATRLCRPDGVTVRPDPRRGPIAILSDLDGAGGMRYSDGGVAQDCLWIIDCSDAPGHVARIDRVDGYVGTTAAYRSDASLHRLVIDDAVILSGNLSAYATPVTLSAATARVRFITGGFHNSAVIKNDGFELHVSCVPREMQAALPPRRACPPADTNATLRPAGVERVAMGVGSRLLAREACEWRIECPAGRYAAISADQVLHWKPHPPAAWWQTGKGIVRFPHRALRDRMSEYVFPVQTFNATCRPRGACRYDVAPAPSTTLVLGNANDTGEVCGSVVADADADDIVASYPGSGLATVALRCATPLRPVAWAAVAADGSTTIHRGSVKVTAGKSALLDATGESMDLQLVTVAGPEAGFALHWQCVCEGTNATLALERMSDTTGNPLPALCDASLNTCGATTPDVCSCSDADAFCSGRGEPAVATDTDGTMRCSCVSCDTGYSGSQCEACADGYDSGPEWSCVARPAQAAPPEPRVCDITVDCSGHAMAVTPAAPGDNLSSWQPECHCDCYANWTGARCDSCAPGFYLGAGGPCSDGAVPPTPAPTTTPAPPPNATATRAFNPAAPSTPTATILPDTPQPTTSAPPPPPTSGAPRSVTRTPPRTADTTSAPTTAPPPPPRSTTRTLTVLERDAAAAAAGNTLDSVTNQAFGRVSSALSLAAASAGGGAGAVAELQTLAVTGLLRCASPELRDAASGLAVTLRPVEIGQSAMRYAIGLLLLVGAVTALHVAVVFAVKAKKKLPSFREAAPAARFPALSLVAWLIATEGFVYESVVLWAKAEAMSASNIAVSVVSFGAAGAIAAAFVAMRRYAVPRTTYTAYAPEDLAALPSVLAPALPTGFWEPRSVTHVCSPVIAGFVPGRTIVAYVGVVRPALIATIAGMQPTTDAGCRVQFVVLGCVPLAHAVIVLVWTPYRSTVANAAIALPALVTATALILVGVGSLPVDTLQRVVSGATVVGVLGSIAAAAIRTIDARFLRRRVKKRLRAAAAAQTVADASAKTATAPDASSPQFHGAPAPRGAASTTTTPDKQQPPSATSSPSPTWSPATAASSREPSPGGALHVPLLGAPGDALQGSLVSNPLNNSSRASPPAQ